MGKIPTGMVKVDDRTLIPSGHSLVVSIPISIIKDVGVKKGDAVGIYSNGKGQVLIDLKPDEE